MGVLCRILLVAVFSLLSNTLLVISLWGIQQRSILLQYLDIVTSFDCTAAGFQGMEQQRQFPHEIPTNISDPNRTHYMDPWGLQVLHHYKSVFPIDGLTSESITLVSQMSLNDLRIQRLLDLASRWSGYMSMTLYFPHSSAGEPTNLTMEEAMRVVDELRANFSSSLRNVDFHIVVNRQRDLDYPINFLRNVALNSARTDFVLVLDADFIPHANAHDMLLKEIKATPTLINDTKALLILPAFERFLMDNETETLVTALDLPPTKEAFLEQWEQNHDLYDEFHRERCGHCHRPTNFRLWYKTREVYKVSYRVSFEPYFVLRKSPTLPPFWEHFTGFGKNKISWIEEMAAAGYQFYVSPESFLIHIHHDYGTDRSGRYPRHILNEYRHFFQPYVIRRYGTHLYDSSDE